jgi:hypothetical protein
LSKTEIKIIVGADVGIVAKIAYPGIANAGHKIPGVVRRAIVGYNEFEIRIGLMQRALQGLRQIAARPVVRRYGDRD